MRRQFFALAAFGVIATGLGACARDNSSTTAPKAKQTAVPVATTQPAGVVTTTPTTLATPGIFSPVKAGVLTVVTSLPGTGFWDGSPSDITQINAGYEFQIATAMAAKLGLKVELRNEKFEDIDAGKITNYDVILTQLSINDRRKSFYDFTTAYFQSDQGILVRTGTSVDGLDTAKGLRWGIQPTTTGSDYLLARVQPAGKAAEYTDLNQGFADVESGKIDAFLMDTAIVLRRAADSGGKLVVAAQFKTGELYGGALPKGSPNKPTFDAILNVLAVDGSLAKFATQSLGGNPNDIKYLG